MRREYPEAPIVTVGLVVRRGDRVLIVQRGKDPNKGRWSIPGGAVEVGETLREAGRREVAEECGIDVTVGKLADVFESVIADADGKTRFHYVILDFFADYVAGELAPASDAMNARWADRTDLEMLDVTPAARDLLKRTLVQVA